MANSLTESVRTKLTSKLIKNLHAETVFAGLTDGKYLSGLKFGASYVVASAVAVNTGAYTGAAITRQKATDVGTTVLIDHSQYFDVALDSPDAEQAEATISEYIDEGKYALATDFDTYIADGLVAGAGTTGATIAIGIDGTPITVTETNIFDYIGLYKTALKEANANLPLCSLVLPPALATILQNARAGAGSDAGSSEQKNGYIDKILGLKIYESNNNPVGVEAVTPGVSVIAFEKRAYKWRDSMKPIQMYQPDETFEDAAKALHVAGGKVVTAINTAVVVGFVA